MGRAYYMLVASLPYLPHFLAAERAPITPQKLAKRRLMLDPEDDAELERALKLLQWRRHPLSRNDREIDLQFRTAMEKTRNASLREFIEFLMAERSVMAGLRRKAKGLGLPPPGILCGVGDWDGIIRRRWEQDDFGLQWLFPWISRARELLAEGDFLGLNKLLKGEAWNLLGRIAERRPFGFEALFAYAFKWDILTRWLSFSEERSAAAFSDLAGEITGEWQPAW
jgi:hypothetical protein